MSGCNLARGPLVSTFEKQLWNVKHTLNKSTMSKTKGGPNKGIKGKEIKKCDKIKR